MPGDQLGQLVIDLLPNLAGHHRFKRRIWDFEGQIARPAMAGIDDPALGVRSNQKTRDRLDRFLGRR